MNFSIKRNVFRIMQAAMIAAMVWAIWNPSGRAGLSDLLKDPLTDGQEKENESAKKVPLGISKSLFIAHVGKPDFVTPSVDGRYQMLEYQTTLPFSSYLRAVVELPAERVVQISHGEDWPEARLLEGYDLPKYISWNTDEHQPYKA